MATVVDNRDGTLTVTLNRREFKLVDDLAEDELAQHLTQWFSARQSTIYQEYFMRLTPEEQDEVLAKFKQGGRERDSGIEPPPIIANPEPPPPDPPPPTIPTFGGVPT